MVNKRKPRGIKSKSRRIKRMPRRVVKQVKPRRDFVVRRLLQRKKRHCRDARS